VKNILAELHGGSSVGRLDVNKALDQARQSDTGFKQEMMWSSGAGTATLLALTDQIGGGGAHA
jgi:hypothetical protein